MKQTASSFSVEPVLRVKPMNAIADATTRKSVDGDKKSELVFMMDTHKNPTRIFETDIID